MYITSLDVEEDTKYGFQQRLHCCNSNGAKERERISFAYFKPRDISRVCCVWVICLNEYGKGVVVALFSSWVSIVYRRLRHNPFIALPSLFLFFLAVL